MQRVGDEDDPDHGHHDVNKGKVEMDVASPIGRDRGCRDNKSVDEPQRAQDYLG